MTTTLPTQYVDTLEYITRSSTTVVVMALCAVCSDNIAPLPGAIAATRTSPKSGLWSAWSLGRAARRGGESRGHSAGPTAPCCFEGCQTVRGRLAQHFFWQGALLQVPGSHDRQQCIRPHRQGDMPIPPRPTADFIVIQADFAFCGFKTALNRPAGARGLRRFRQGGGLGGKDHKGRQVGGRTQTTPDQQPAAP